MYLRIIMVFLYYVTCEGLIPMGPGAAKNEDTITTANRGRLEINSCTNVNEECLHADINRNFNRKTFLPRNCQDAKERGHNETGFYTIHPDFAPEPFLVLCDMDTRGGGWTFLLNRFNGHQNFHLPWNDYKHGFGNLAGDFWLGLEHLHELTSFEINELLIEMEDWDEKKVYAYYDIFAIGGEHEGYNIKILGGFEGTAGDSLRRHAGMKFTTYDVDHDTYNSGNCAFLRHGGWWHGKCGNCQLTGKYMSGETIAAHEFQGIFWEGFHGSRYSLKKVRMIVRPKIGGHLNDE